MSAPTRRVNVPVVRNEQPSDYPPLLDEDSHAFNVDTGEAFYRSTETSKWKLVELFDTIEVRVAIDATSDDIREAAHTALGWPAP